MNPAIMISEEKLSSTNRQRPMHELGWSCSGQLQEAFAHGKLRPILFCGWGQPTALRHIAKENNFTCTSFM